MMDPLANGLREATRLTGSGRLVDATAAIQRLLRGQASAPQNPARAPGEPRTSGRPTGRMISPVDGLSETPQQPVHGLRARLPHRARGTNVGPSPAPAFPDTAQFLSRTFANHAGSRPYKLYVPASYRADTPSPLIVMLHGCTQTPDDFAADTRMNELAETRGFLVAYPGQTQTANMQKCWNWFNAKHQSRDAGEPSLIAGITRQVMANYAVDASRVFVAGLSAGGAAAAIMGQAYPSLYAGIGIHSGLACGAARDLPSALAAMRQGAEGNETGTALPTIVFHGDRDSTVNPRNGDVIVAQLANAIVAKTWAETGQVSGGRSYTRTVYTDSGGRTVAEHWVVHGAIHAWSGGSSSGSYTDPSGPDASAEMVRFFLEISAQKARASRFSNVRR